MHLERRTPRERGRGHRASVVDAARRRRAEAAQVFAMATAATDQHDRRSGRSARGTAAPRPGAHPELAANSPSFGRLIPHRAAVGDEHDQATPAAAPIPLVGKGERLTEQHNARIRSSVKEHLGRAVDKLRFETVTGLISIAAVMSGCLRGHRLRWDQLAEYKLVPLPSGSLVLPCAPCHRHGSGGDSDLILEGETTGQRSTCARVVQAPKWSDASDVRIAA